jgi:hypothetical protein
MLKPEATTNLTAFSNQAVHLHHQIQSSQTSSTNGSFINHPYTTKPVAAQPTNSHPRAPCHHQSCLQLNSQSTETISTSFSNLIAPITKSSAPNPNHGSNQAQPIAQATTTNNHRHHGFFSIPQPKSGLSTQSHHLNSHNHHRTSITTVPSPAILQESKRRPIHRNAQFVEPKLGFSTNENSCNCPVLDAVCNAIAPKPSRVSARSLTAVPVCPCRAKPRRAAVSHEARAAATSLCLQPVHGLCLY